MTQKVYLGGICDIKIGRTPPRKHPQWFSSSHGMKWVSIKDMGNTGKYISQTSELLTMDAISKFNIPIIPAGTLLMSFKLTVGRLGFTEYDMCSNEAIAQLPIKDPDIVDKNYLYYYLKNFNFDSLSSTSSIATAVNSKTVKNISVNLPPLDRQKKIANILGSLDEKIELNRRMNEILEQLGQALFRHYFVDNHEAKDWENIYLGDIVAITAGKGSTKANLSEYGKYPLYGANGVMGRSQNYLLNEKVIVTGRVGTLGVVRAVVDKAWFSDNVIIMKPDPSIFGYVFYVVCGIDYASLNRGSTQPLITQTDLKNQRVKLPPLSTLQRFENSYVVIFNQIQANKRQVSTLVAIRNSLLPKLISGEIEI